MTKKQLKQNKMAGLKLAI